LTVGTPRPRRRYFLDQHKTNGTERDERAEPPPGRHSVGVGSAVFLRAIELFAPRTIRLLKRTPVNLLVQLLLDRSSQPLPEGVALRPGLA